MVLAAENGLFQIVKHSNWGRKQNYQLLMHSRHQIV